MKTFWGSSFLSGQIPGSSLAANPPRVCRSRLSPPAREGRALEIGETWFLVSGNLPSAVGGRPRNPALGIEEGAPAGAQAEALWVSDRATLFRGSRPATDQPEVKKKRSSFPWLGTLAYAAVARSTGIFGGSGFILFGCIPRRGLAGSYGGSIFNFLGTFILFSIMAAAVSIPSAEGSLSSTRSLTPVTSSLW